MAIKIPHVVDRDGVFYYVRRVPKAVLDRPGAKERFFNGQEIVRASLFTSNPTKAAELAAHASREFEARVQQALDEGAGGLPRKLSPVTDQALRQISAERKRATANHFRQLVLMREMGGEAAEYAENMIYQMEMDAESIGHAVQSGGGEGDPHYDIRAQAREMIHDEGLDAPDGSTDFARIVSVLRQAEFQALTEGFDVVYGRKSILDLQPAQATLASIVPRPSSIMLSEAFENYISRKQNKRTINGIREALKCFVAVCGDLPLAELRADHFRQFCAAEASRDVGGKTKGSVC